MDELRKNRSRMVEKIAHNELDMEECGKQLKLISDELAELSKQLTEIETNRTRAMANISVLDEVTAIAETSEKEMTEYSDAIIRQIMEQIKVMSADEIEITFIGSITQTAFLQN